MLPADAERRPGVHGSVPEAGGGDEINVIEGHPTGSSHEFVDQTLHALSRLVIFGESDVHHIHMLWVGVFDARGRESELGIEVKFSQLRCAQGAGSWHEALLGDGVVSSYS